MVTQLAGAGSQACGHPQGGRRLLKGRTYFLFVFTNTGKNPYRQRTKEGVCRALYVTPQSRSGNGGCRTPSARGSNQVETNVMLSEGGQPWAVLGTQAPACLSQHLNFHPFASGGCLSSSCLTCIPANERRDVGREGDTSSFEGSPCKTQEQRKLGNVVFPSGAKEEGVGRSPGLLVLGGPGLGPTLGFGSL